jgi:ABC-type phosphate/phosphonate transport system substrate-binding protein
MPNFSGLLFLSLVGWLAFTPMSRAHAAVPTPSSLLFAVNEGTSSSSDAIFRDDKYAGLSKYLRAATGKPVQTITSNVLSTLIRNLQEQRYDVLLVRPSHISARAMRDHGYRLLVTARGEARLHFIVRQDSELQTLKDVAGKYIALPDKNAYPTHLALAALRDAGIVPQPDRLHFMDRQEAVGYVVKEKLGDVGAVISYSKVAKEWPAQGGRFLYTKDNLPFWSVIVSNKIDAATEARLRNALLDLDKTLKGREILEKIGVAGFVVGDQQAYLDMLRWVEGK